MFKRIKETKHWGQTYEELGVLIELIGTIQTGNLWDKVGDEVLKRRVQELEEEVARQARTLKAFRRMRNNGLQLPQGVRAADLPDGCPGWGNYTTNLAACSLCRVNLECMSAGDDN
jgi:hypothetical protein